MQKVQFRGAPRQRSTKPKSSLGHGPVRHPLDCLSLMLPQGQRANTYEPYILEAAARDNIPANLLRAVIRVESTITQIISSAGAKGLMQLMPGTAKDMAVTNIFDPRQNIFGGTRYLRLLFNRGDQASHRCIPCWTGGRCGTGCIPYEATRRYVRSVLEHYLRNKQARL